MIRAVEKEELEQCIQIFHRGYGTVADEFGLTEENSPDRGRAALPCSRLQEEFDEGVLMYGYFLESRLVGFLGIKMAGNVCKLNDIIILPEYRNNGYGTELLDFCRKKAVQSGKKKIILGMIDDNIRLRNWYISNGFVNTGYRKYEGAPYTVGDMECLLQQVTEVKQ